MTRLEVFAEQHILKVTQDESNDKVIQGRRGQLYFDGPALCLMILNGPVRAKSVLEAVGSLRIVFERAAKNPLAKSKTSVTGIV